MYTSLDQEHRRLSKQCQQILARLQQGRVSNRELAGIALKYTGRLSDLRKAGIAVEVVERNFASGETWYALKRHATIDPDGVIAFLPKASLGPKP